MNFQGPLSSRLPCELQIASCCPAFHLVAFGAGPFKNLPPHGTIGCWAAQVQSHSLVLCPIRSARLTHNEAPHLEVVLDQMSSDRRRAMPYSSTPTRRPALSSSSAHAPPKLHMAAWKVKEKMRGSSLHQARQKAGW